MKSFGSARVGIAAVLLLWSTRLPCEASVFSGSGAIALDSCGPEVRNRDVPTPFIDANSVSFTLNAAIATVTTAILCDFRCEIALVASSICTAAPSRCGILTASTSRRRRSPVTFQPGNVNVTDVTDIGSSQSLVVYHVDIPPEYTLDDNQIPVLGQAVALEILTTAEVSIEMATGLAVVDGSIAAVNPSSPVIGLSTEILIAIIVPSTVVGLACIVAVFVAIVAIVVIAKKKKTKVVPSASKTRNLSESKEVLLEPA